MNDKKRRYGLFDAALMPQVWFNLDNWQLAYEPLYQGNYQPIAEAIPYLIELDEAQDNQAVSDLLERNDYQAGLLLKSSDSLSELIRRLAYFYHVRNEQNEPLLRRFFDLRLFDDFVQFLPEEYLQFLFGKDTVFYYLDKTLSCYQKISLLNNKLLFEQVDLSDFKQEEKTMKKTTALLSVFIATFTATACSEAGFREEFFKHRPCAEIKYQCLPENQEKTMIDTSKPYVISAQEWAHFEQDKTLRMYKEIAQMLEIYYPGFWGDTDEKTKIAWVEQAHELTKKYSKYPNLRGHIEMMAQICAIIGINFDKNPNFKFVVNKLNNSDDPLALNHILNYFRFEILKKNFSVGGVHYNTWSLRGVQEGMPKITRHIPDFHTENQPRNQKENLRRVYDKTVLNGGGR